MKTRLVLLVTFAIMGISATARGQWLPNGAAVCTEGSVQEHPRITLDGAGGVLIAWEDRRGVTGRDVFVQRVNSSGVAQWATNGVSLCNAVNDQQSFSMVSDGAGGAIVFWQDNRDAATNNADLYCRRIGANGAPQWGVNGVPICVLPENQIGCVAIPDGSGGAIVTWRDFRNEVDYDIYAQRVNASGVVQWTANGVVVASLSQDQTIPEITSDGAGGAIIAWFDRRSSPNADVYAQRISSAGAPVWALNGVSISSVTGVQRNPTLVGDGANGAFVAWWDTRSGNDDIYAQHVSSSGTSLWAANGVPVCTAPGAQLLPRIVNSGTGVVIVWDDARGADGNIYAQRLNSQGAPIWIVDGIAVCGAAGDQYTPSIATDGSGGVAVAWNDWRDGEVEADVYAQRVTSAGILSWVTDGVLLGGATAIQWDPVLASDGAGGAIVAWQDDRVANDTNIFAQRVLSSGTLPFTTPVAARTPSLYASEIYPNPVTGVARINVELNSAAAVRVDLFDVAGRLVRAEAGRRDGTSRIAIDARDNAGRLLPSGVYFCRVRAASETITRKMVIAR